MIRKVGLAGYTLRLHHVRSQFAWQGYSSLHPRLQKVPISGFRHPSRTGEMALVYDFGTIWFARWVKAEDHLDDLTPVGPLFFGHQQPNINCKMFLVVGVDTIGYWRPVLEWRCVHCNCPSASMQRLEFI